MSESVATRTGMTAASRERTEAAPVSNAYRRAVYLTVVRVAANLIMLGAVCLGMYMSSKHPASALLVFCQYFFGVTVVAWFAAGRLSSFIRRRFADADEGPVRLPGHRRECLVHWRVANASPTPQRVTAPRS